MVTYNELLMLCADEIFYWKGKISDYSSYSQKIDIIHKENHALTCYDVANNVVQVRSRTHYNALDQLLSDRINVYANFLQTIFTKFLVDINITIPMILDDCARGNDDTPLFSFQKIINDNLLLLPDMEFMSYDFYDSPDYQDHIEFDRKSLRASFIGSTTGKNKETGLANLNTKDSIDNNPSERIRAAKYFSNMNNIYFKLPVVVQCDSRETEEYLKSFEFCKNERMSWKQQFESKYIISLDGNGATCSRVTVTLASHSVLLKYKSENILYFFKGLIPWTHYIPIQSDQDVINVIQTANSYSSMHQSISKNANHFYDQMLNKVNVYKYAAVVINEFYSLFHDDAVYQANKIRIDSLHCLVSISVHLQNKGDQWCWPSYIGGIPQSGLALEGFIISTADSLLANKEIEYQCLYQDKSISDWLPGGRFCGTRGKCMGLIGIRIRLLGLSQTKVDLQYRATYIKNVEKGPWIKEGNWCDNGHSELIESFELRLTERHPSMLQHQFHYSRNTGENVRKLN